MVAGLGRIRSDRAFDFFNNAFLSIALILVLYPLTYIVSSSFSGSDAVMAGKVWLWPVDFTLEGYKTILEYRHVWTGYANSFLYAGVGTVVNVILTIMAAYPLSRRDFKDRKIFMFLITFTMIFHAGLIPTYLVVRSLGLLNTRAAMVLPTAVAAWNVIITRTYYQKQITPDLLDASKMDGASDIRFMLAVVLPLSGAITAVNVLFYAVFHWNEYFNAFIYLHDRSLYPLQIVLREILILNTVDVTMMTSVDVDEMAAREAIRELLKYSLIIVSSLPVLMLYPFVQRHFVRGVMIGSIKG